MSRQARESHGLQVFPFLAVLVCTMGALIFLLLVTTSQIRKRPVDSSPTTDLHETFAKVDAESLKPPNRGFPDPDPKTESATIVIPPQPPSEKPRPSKPVKVPDQSYALALAQREREIDELTTKWKLRTNILSREKKRYEAALKEHKALFDAAVERADALQSDVSKLEGQLGHVERDVAAADADHKDELELQRIAKQIAEMKKRLLAAQAEEAAPGNEKFQVIPFDVQNGTTRRPIFIECTGNGIRFQPENIVITAADLEGFPAHINPLAAGTGALINYWTEVSRKQRGLKPASEPYVLLLVRPDGIYAYYVALKMLEPIRTPHGYELVEDSIKLEYPETDQAAKAACQRAIEHVMSERETITRAAVAYGGAGTVFGGSNRSPGQAAGTGAESPGGRGSGGNGGSGSGNSRGSNGGNGGFSMNDVTGDNTAVGSHSWERIENFIGERPQKRRSAVSGNGGGSGSGSNHVAAGYPGGAPTSGGGNGSGHKSSGGGTYSGSSTGGVSQRTSFGGIENSTALAGGAGGAAGGKGGSPQAGAASGASTPGGSSAERSDNSMSMFGDDDDDAEPLGPGLGQPRQGGSQIASGLSDQTGESSNFGLSGSVPDIAGNGSNSPQPGTTQGKQGLRSGPGGTANSRNGQPGSGQFAGGALVDGNQADGSGDPTLSNSQQSGSASGGAAGSGNVGKFGSGAVAGGGGSTAYMDRADPNYPVGEHPGKKKKNNSQTASADDAIDAGDDSAADGAPGGYGRAGGGPGRSARGNRPMLSDDGSSGPRDPRGNRPSANSTASRGKPGDEATDRQLEPEMLAGRRWGLCEAGAAIALEREVRVDVSPGKLVIAELFEVPAGPDVSRQETFERFATTLDRFSREWGRPPHGVYWTPHLKFIVKPEAYGQFEQINAMVVRAGLATSFEIAKGSEAIEYGRETTGNTKPPTKSAARTYSGGAR